MWGYMGGMSGYAEKRKVGFRSSKTGESHGKGNANKCMEIGLIQGYVGGSTVRVFGCTVYVGALTLRQTSMKPNMPPFRFHVGLGECWVLGSMVFGVGLGGSTWRRAS